MLSKTERLSRANFDAHFKRGKRIHSPYFTVVVSPSPHFHGSVVVSKKVSKRAPTRNTIRRRIYAQLQQVKTNHTLTTVFIVVVKPLYTSLSRTKAKDELLSLIEQVVKST